MLEIVYHKGCTQIVHTTLMFSLVSAQRTALLNRFRSSLLNRAISEFPIKRFLVLLVLSSDISRSFIRFGILCVLFFTLATICKFHSSKYCFL